MRGSRTVYLEDGVVEIASLAEVVEHGCFEGGEIGLSKLAGS